MKCLKVNKLLKDLEARLFAITMNYSRPINKASAKKRNRNDRDKDRHGDRDKMNHASESTEYLAEEGVLLE